MEDEFDVVIVGSGYGGAITAARLAEAGMLVLVLERGPRLETEDLRQTDDPRFIQRIVDLVVTTSNIAFRTGTLVGGASFPMDGAHFRMPALSYEVEDASGRRYWPGEYTKDALAPWLDIAERMLRVRQMEWGEISKAGGLFAKMLDQVGASCERARMNYADCLQCGFCSTGCIYDKKVTVLHTYIPLAESHGAEIRAEAMVDHVEPEGTGYRVLFTLGGEARGVFGQRVIVAAGGIHSPALLLRSAAFLPGLSEQTGENFNNNGEHQFIGILPPEFDALDGYDCFKGMDNAGMMTFEWLESDGFTLHPGGGLEPSIFAAALAAADDPVFPSRPWGMEYKRFCESVYPHRVIGFSSLGLADGHRAVVVRGNGDVDLSERDRTANDAYLDRLEATVFDIGRQTGIKLIPSTPRKLAGTTSAHLLAACRMAESREHGVVDASCQVFGHRNLYVCDASVIPYAMAVNPALTVSAIAEKTAAAIIERG